MKAFDALNALGFPSVVNDTFQVEAGPPTKRPLWSNLSGSARQHYIDTFDSAYRQMLQLPPENPRSLIYQAWIHYFYCLSNGPVSAASPQIHGNAAFLPWHRAYLFYFERLIRHLSGVAGFRLAVWDWENNDHLPPPYLNWVSIPDMPNCTVSREITRVDVPDLTGWLRSTRSRDFQGDRYAPGNSVHGPHGEIHLALRGFMRRLELAAFDPIFFAHHANIDRFWDAWYRHYRNVPHFSDLQTWPLQPPAWIFYDARINRHVSVKLEQMLNIDHLGYTYDPPAINLFEAIILSAIPKKDSVGINPKDLLDFIGALSRAAGALFPAASMPLPAALSGAGGFEKFLAGLADSASANFRLPVVARFELPLNAPSGIYALGFKAGSRTVALGSFAVQDHRHDAQPVPAFLSLALRDLGILFEGLQNRLRITITPGLLGTNLKSLELQYPSNLDGWRTLLLKK